MNKVIQGLWVGDRLSAMERLSIKSFLGHGHEYHLYAYDEIKNIPSGTIIKDGNEILPENEIFTYSFGEGKGSVSAFSNFFRYKLLYDKGGWWADTDMICVKPFDFESKYVFASESLDDGTDCVTSGIIKVPKGCESIKHAWEVCCSKNRERLAWGEVGPRLVGEIVEKFFLTNFIQLPQTFCPLGYKVWHEVLNPNIDLLSKITKEVYAIHLWNEMWRRSNVSKDGAYNSGCLYEQLKEKHGL